MQNRPFWTLTLLIAIFGMFHGCGRKPVPGILPEPAQPAEAGANQQPAVSITDKPLLPIEDLVARVNGEGITREEFDKVFQHLLSQQEQNLTTDEKFNLRVNVLNDLIMAKVITQNAVEADLPVAATEIDLAMDRVRENFHFNEREFLASLAAQGMTLDQFRKSIERELKTSKFQDMIMSRYSVEYTEEDLKDWFDEHRDVYRFPELVRVSHILISVPQDADNATIERAHQQARKIREQITTLGVDFGEAALKYSDDVDSATGGGLLGDITRGMTVKSFEEAAFALRVGEISPPVRTYRGWHIIKVNARRPAKPLTFEQAYRTGHLQEDYEANRRALYFSDWLRNERTRTTVEILDPSIAVLPR